MARILSNTLNRAIDLAKAGSKNEARALFEHILRDNPDHEVAFLWYLDTLATDEERIRELEAFLQRHPDHQKTQMLLQGFRTHVEAKKARALASELNTQKSTDEELDELMDSLSGSSVHELLEHEALKSLQQSRRPLRSKQRLGMSSSEIISLVVTALVLIACCAGLFIPYLMKQPAVMALYMNVNQRYATQMEEVLTLTDELMNQSVAQWDQLMNEKVYPDSNATYREMLYYNMQLGTSDVNVARKLSPTITQISMKSAEIMTNLKDVEPPQDIAEAHKNMVACIEYEAAWSVAIYDFLNTSQTFQLPGNPCKTFPQSFAEVKAFVTRYK